MPKQISFLEIQPTEIVLSALKKCEHRDTLVLRLFNPTNKKIVGKIRTYSQIKEAWLTNMNEERREEIKAEKNSLTVEFGKKKINTCEVVFG